MFDFLRYRSGVSGWFFRGGREGGGGGCEFYLNFLSIKFICCTTVKLASSSNFSHKKMCMYKTSLLFDINVWYTIKNVPMLFAFWHMHAYKYTFKV